MPDLLWVSPLWRRLYEEDLMILVHDVDAFEVVNLLTHWMEEWVAEYFAFAQQVDDFEK
jgi:hypothetical protein